MCGQDALQDSYFCNSTGINFYLSHFSVTFCPFYLVHFTNFVLLNYNLFHFLYSKFFNKFFHFNSGVLVLQSVNSRVHFWLIAERIGQVSPSFSIFSVDGSEWN